MSDKAKYEKVVLVFVQECLLSDKKPGLEFVRLSLEEFDHSTPITDWEARAMVFAKKPMKTSTTPGMAYAFEAERHADGRLSVLLGTRRFLCRYHDRDKVLEWEAANRAYCNARDSLAMEKKEATKSLLAETLAPLRDRYRKLPYPHRQALLAAVLYEITK